MSQRVDHRYWARSLQWHLFHNHRKSKAVQRRGAWTFTNYICWLPAGSLVIDGGANVGWATAALVRYGFEVHAFEPDPVAGATFERRFGAHPSVHLHRAALGTGSMTMRLFRTKDFSRHPERATLSSSLFRHEKHDEANATVLRSSIL